MNVTSRIKVIRHHTAEVAAQTTITPATGVDMAGAESCLFVVLWGVITGTGVQSIKVQQSSDNGVGDGFSDLTGSSVSVSDTSDGKMTFVEVVNPEKRYLKCLVLRGTANSVVDGILAFVQGSSRLPVTQPTATVASVELHQTPIEGTA